jgi:hypothetical protein
MSVVEESAGRVFESILSEMDVCSIHLCDRLGHDRALSEKPATAGQLAEGTGTHPRYAREWLGEQAVTGIVDVMDETDDPDARRFTLPADDVGRLMYGSSILIYLPDGRSQPGSAVTRTAMCPDMLHRYATEAGFADLELLPIRTDFWRFCRLHR